MNAVNFQANADAVLEEVTRFQMPARSRRDSNGRHWLFHFIKSRDIMDCRMAIIRSHPHAFSLSSAAVATAVAVGAVGVATIPMAFTAIVHKVGVGKDDVKPIEFFYL